MKGPAPSITFTTDFGADDWFVGTMKGVVLGIAPRARLIDITHAIPPGNLRAAAFALKAAVPYFPKGAIHVAIVDPGVGSERHALAVRTRDCCLVGPDNGVLSWAMNDLPPCAVHRLEAAKYFLPAVSRTFHGRDVFAPVAAHLARGVSLRHLGPATKEWVRLPWPLPRISVGKVQGEVLYVDHFGNGITNLDAGALAGLGRGPLEVAAGNLPRLPLGACYQAVPVGKPVAVLGSTGFLEVAICGGSAARELGLAAGRRIAVLPRGA